MDQLVHSHSEDDLVAVAGNPHLTEDLIRSLLARRDLPGAVLVELSKNGQAMKMRSTVLGLVCHPRTPRYVSIPITRYLYIFELVQVTTQPAVPADIKMAVENAIITRLESISAGERMSLARRCSTRVAGALLVDPDMRIVEIALNNPYLTEITVVHALRDDDITESFIRAVARHPKWWLRNEVKVAMLLNEKTPESLALEIVHSLPANMAREALLNSELPAATKAYLLSEIHPGS